jgi:LacI family transcriptional regulator
MVEKKIRHDYRQKMYYVRHFLPVTLVVSRNLPVYSLSAMHDRITQDSIARALGLSIKTVQRAFSGSDKVAESTKTSIQNYAAMVGYSRNRGARALVRNNLQSMHLFSSSSPEYFWSKVARGMESALVETRDFGYAAFYHPIPPRNTAAYMKELQRASAEGLDAAAVVNNPEYDMGRIFGFLDHRRIPYITLNIDATETQRLGFIGPDYGAGGRLAAEFIGKTIRSSSKVLIIHNPVDSEHILAGAHVNEERLLHFVSYLSVHFPYIEHQVVSFGSNQSRTDIEQELEDILTGGADDFTGIYSIADMQELLGKQILRRGLESRYIILVHGVTPETEMYLRSHAFTAAIHQNPFKQGYYAIKLLEYYLENGAAPSTIPPVSQGIVLGHSMDYEDDIWRFE